MLTIYFPWCASYKIPVAEEEVIEVRGTECPRGIGQLASLLNHSLLVSPQVSKQKRLVVMQACVMTCLTECN